QCGLEQVVNAADRATAGELPDRRSRGLRQVLAPQTDLCHGPITASPGPCTSARGLVPEVDGVCSRFSSVVVPQGAQALRASITCRFGSGPLRRGLIIGRWMPEWR